LDKNVKQKILFEISQIDEVIDSTKPLRDLCKIKMPDIIEKSAVALLLQSFYNGIENILMMIIRKYPPFVWRGNRRKHGGQDGKVSYL
jgi:hypothetical protein